MGMSGEPFYKKGLPAIPYTTSVRSRGWRGLLVQGAKFRGEEGGLEVGGLYYLPAAARFDALSGLSFWFCSATLRSMWVAKLHFPRAHFVAGLGATVQKMPSEAVKVREQPSH